MTAPFPWSETLLARMDEAAYVVDRTRRITYWNEAAEELTGFRAAEVIGRRCRDGVLSHVDETGRLLCDDGCPLTSTIRRGTLSEVCAYVHHRDGHRLPVTITTAPLYDVAGDIYGAVEVFHDDGRSQELRVAADRAAALGRLDSLTGVPHRGTLEADLGRRHQVMRRTGRGFAVALLDVDRLAMVNRAHGQEVGGRVLQLVAATATHAVRPGDTIGRWDGDVFLLLTDVDALATAVELCHRVRGLVAESWLEERTGPVRTSVSIGVTLGEPDASPDDLVDRADQALLQAKAAGRNRVFSSDTHGTAAA